MPYIVKKGSGKRPFRIVNQKTGEVVGTSTTLKNAHGSIAHRMDAESKNVKSYIFKKDNHMRGFGDVDTGKHIVRVNKSKSKNRIPGEILDTIEHEKSHIRHPKMHEDSIRKITSRITRQLNKKLKQRDYHLVTT